jgi:soluble lytic murein transglycosylase-like protein
MSEAKPRPTKTAAKKKPAKSGVSLLDSARSVWTRLARIGKPRVEVKTGRAALEAEHEAARRPLTPARLLIQLAPVWALLIMVLILEPALPFRAVGSVINWAIRLWPTPPPVVTAEPEYVVEGPTQADIQTTLPAPTWPLEIAPIFTPEVQFWAAEIGEWSLAYRIKPNMIAAVMQIESCGNPKVTSPDGGVGLFQVDAASFQPGEDPTDPNTNAARGLARLGMLLASANGEPGRTFAAYNGGDAVLYTSPAEWSSETQLYQFWAGGLYEDAEIGIESSPTLSDWLEAGGAALCAAASQQLGLAR